MHPAGCLAWKRTSVNVHDESNVANLRLPPSSSIVLFVQRSFPGPPDPCSFVSYFFSVLVDVKVCVAVRTMLFRSALPVAFVGATVSVVKYPMKIYSFIKPAWVLHQRKSGSL